MRRPGLLPALVVAVLATACGASSVTTAPAGAAVSAPSTTTAAIPPVETTAPSDREAAPDFTLALGDGGSFTLSQETKPVYMVFWAEW